MSLSDDGIADSEDIRQQRGAVPRVVASLVVAFFAYLGLALGGGFATFASAETNNFSAAKGNQQPHYLTLRDNARGIVAAQRDVVPKAGWLDGNAALVAPDTAFAPFRSDTALPMPREQARTKDRSATAYLARGPPAAFA